MWYPEAGALLLTPALWAGNERFAQLSITTSRTLISVSCLGANRIRWPNFNCAIHSWSGLLARSGIGSTRWRASWRCSARRGRWIKGSRVSPSQRHHSPSPLLLLLLLLAVQICARRSAVPAPPLLSRVGLDLCWEVTEDTALSTAAGHAHPAWRASGPHILNPSEVRLDEQLPHLSLLTGWQLLKELGFLFFVFCFKLLLLK